MTKEQDNIKRFEDFTKNRINISIDTEFQNLHTLCIQMAIRTGKDEVTVQLFRSPSIPNVPRNFNANDHFATTMKSYEKFFKTVILRKPAPLTSSLSPVKCLGHLLGVSSLQSISREEAAKLASNRKSKLLDATWDIERKVWLLPKIRLVLIGHNLQSDIARIFGSHFYSDLFARRDASDSPVLIGGDRKLGFVQEHANFTDQSPIVEYAFLGSRLYEVRIETRDTLLPFGPAGLDRLCKTFLNIGKADDILPAEKCEMLRTFKSKPEAAYGYAIVDVVNTLCLHEKMVESDSEIYRSFGIKNDQIPKMAATVGARVRDFLVTTTKRFASTSKTLSNHQKLTTLMRRGGISQFSGAHALSRFGHQTAAIPGGLSLSRTPTQFWHEAHGMLRDVDLSGCYNHILATMHVYWGRPIVLEPGKNKMSVVEAVTFVCQYSDNDAWFSRVTGDLNAMPNVLIPSTVDAITTKSYRSAVHHARRAATRKTNSSMSVEHKTTSKLFSRRIESGVITMPTWLMIQALPDAARREYESLIVDAVVFYHQSLVAACGDEYDKMLTDNWSDTLPWKTVFDDENLQLIHTEDLDHEYVALRFPMAKYAKQIGDERERAKKEFGKGSGQDFALKIQANTMFGVLASRHHPTNNVIAANQITAHARAEAFAMMLSLNGLQVITDGCSYRRDRIPAITFAECLELMPDYPLRHADDASGISFVPPDEIPEDDGEFTIWYREHVKRFFNVKGEAYDKLFATHALEHKQTGDTGVKTFDAMACDGNGNYLKVMCEEGGLVVRESKMRGYSEESKVALHSWIVDAYSQDRMKSLPPVSSQKVLLKLHPAKKAAKKSLQKARLSAVFLPLGLEKTIVRCFTVIKPSSFVFQTPEQMKAMKRQIEKFLRVIGYGLDLIVLRKRRGKSRQHSISAVAEELYEYIQSGGRDLTKKFNLNLKHFAKRIHRIVRCHIADVQNRRDASDSELFDKIDADKLTKNAKLTGILVTRLDRHLLE